MERDFRQIGNRLSNFQAALNQQGQSFEEFIKQNYSKKWLSDELYHASAIRTTLVNSCCEFLADEGLFNMERILMSIITDPLAHDIEHTPSISYKGQTYLTTHSMIYSKFLACSNPRIKGVYVDSPNIRLELEAPNHKQREKYLIDFSQIDIEMKRGEFFSLEDYFEKESEVLESIDADRKRFKNMLERMLIYAIGQINQKNSESLLFFDVVLEAPDTPFPTFELDYAVGKYGKKDAEAMVGGETKSQFFWIDGLMRENYDLIYPYLKKDGTKVPLSSVKSPNIFNYDIAAKSICRSTGKQASAREVLSGAVREWLYEPIVERILDNKVLTTRPILKDGNIENLDELGGYGPFLKFCNMKDDNGKPIFPSTMGGGIGVERLMYAVLRGKRIKKVDDITFFGKNPDSHQIYLF